MHFWSTLEINKLHWYQKHASTRSNCKTAVKYLNNRCVIKLKWLQNVFRPLHFVHTLWCRFNFKCDPPRRKKCSIMFSTTYTPNCQTTEKHWHISSDPPISMDLKEPPLIVDRRWHNLRNRLVHANTKSKGKKYTGLVKAPSKRMLQMQRMCSILILILGKSTLTRMFHFECNLHDRMSSSVILNC